jgi:hypothetical protein
MWVDATAHRGAFTRISFSGNEADDVLVKETPEQLLDLLDGAS